MKANVIENIDVDLSETGGIDGERLRNVSLMPRLWFDAVKMGEAEWSRAARTLSIMTSANPHIAPQLIFITKDVSGLLDRSGLQKLKDGDHTRPSILERYRELIHEYPDIADCRPQVDLIAAVPAESPLNQDDVRKIRESGFRPSAYINDCGDLQNLLLNRGVGIVLDFPLPEDARLLFLEIALLSGAHFIVWHDGDNESKFRDAIRAFHASKYNQKIFGINNDRPLEDNR